MLQELFSEQLDKFDKGYFNDQKFNYSEIRSFLVKSQVEIYKKLFEEIKNLRDKNSDFEDDKIDEVLTKLLEKL